MAEELSPISAAKPPVVNPVSTLKLKPVIRKPLAAAADAKTVIRPSLRSAAAPGLKPMAISKPAAPESVAAVDHLKNVTQKLKGVTQEIPAQAILHKTGIIADQALTEAQKQASKSRTARISLADAIGVAPVTEQKPMKTIRIKRPVDLQNPAAGNPEPSAPVAALAASEPPSPAPAPAPAPAPTPAPAPAPAEAAAPSSVTQQITQRKTLKISRPGSGIKPVGLKKPSLSSPAKPAAADGKAAGGGEVADIPDIADIPEMPVPALAPASANKAGNPADVPTAVAVIGLVAQVAACAAIAFLGWGLYQVTQLKMFCGGLQP